MKDSLGISFSVPTQSKAYELGLKFTQEIQRQLTGHRTGRWYPVAGNKFYDKHSPPIVRAKNYHIKFTGTSNRHEIRGGAYRASAPGEPPASYTGRLRQSFLMEVTSAEQGMWKVKIWTSVKYADDLEYGTDKIEPRPFILPALRKLLPEILRARIAGGITIIKK